MTVAYPAGLCPASLPTLTEAWEMFAQERRISVAPTSFSTDYRQSGNWIRSLKCQDLAQGRQVLIEVLQRQPEKSARKVVMFVKSMYKWLASEDVAILPRNPVAGFRMPKAPQSQHEIQIVSREELPLCLVALEYKAHHTATNWSLLADAQVQGGYRTGEVFALRWQDIEGNKIKVHANYTLTHGYKPSTKTNRARTVPLNARALEIFNQLPRTSEFIFPWNRQAYQSFFRLKMDQLFDAGLIKARYRPYDLRHVAISRWLESGIPVATCANWAGNTSEIIWKHYANQTKEYDMPVL